MNRVKLVLLFGLFILPILASYLTYYIWQPEGRKNYGDLVKQTEMHLQGSNLGGAPMSMESLKGKWVMVYVGDAACDKQCEQLLYFMRQTRKAQGKEMDRVERVWIITDAAVPSSQLQQAHAGLHYLRVQDSNVMKEFADSPKGAHLYMVDPQAHLMMRWPKQPDPARMIKDIKHLLKASQIG